MDTLNVAVIGVGSWGKNHARVFNELELTNLVGVYDLDAKRAQNLAKEHNTTFYSNLEDMMKSEEIDAISIASSHFNPRYLPLAFYSMLPAILHEPQKRLFQSFFKIVFWLKPQHPFSLTDIRVVPLDFPFSFFLENNLTLTVKKSIG